MSVKEWGTGADPALMLHCTLAQGSAWAGVARHLLGALTMRAPDLLAHGDGPDADPARDFCDQATEAAAAHLTEPMHLIGHSFGAVIALRLALDWPERVKSLTLIEPVLFCASDGPGRAAHDAAAARVPQALVQDDAAGAARHFLDLWGEAPFDALPAALQTYITDRIWIPSACEPGLISDRAGILPRVPSVQMPTLLIDGAGSPPVIAEIMARLARDIPTAQRRTVAGAAHMAPLTHARDVATAIADAHL